VGEISGASWTKDEEGLLLQRYDEPKQDTAIVTPIISRNFITIVSAQRNRKTS